MEAIILAGGRGTRLAPLTDHLPKSLVPVDGEPIISRQLWWLQENGVERVWLMTGYRAAQIYDYVRDGARWGVEVCHLSESKPLGRGGALKVGLGQAKVGSVVALNGDVLTDLDLGHFERFAGQYSSLWAFLVAVQPPSPYGQVVIGSNHRVCEFQEKGRYPGWVNAGIYRLDTFLCAQLPEVGDHEDSTFPALVAQGRLGVYPSESAWWTSIDSLRDLEMATQHYQEAE